jgi:DNA-binding NtrC family response regulator
VRKFQEMVAGEAVALRLAHDLGEASQVMHGAQPPHVVFTDTKLSDGDWQDVLTLALKAAQAVNVVVVSAVGNISLYFEAMELGAFDFLTPNIAPRDFRLLLQAAAEDAVARRAGNHAEAAPPLSRRGPQRRETRRFTAQ